jgi:hypothetical protein
MLYCLTNNGELGKINEEIDNKLIIYKLNKKGEILYNGNCIITLTLTKDEVLSTSSNINFLNAQRDSLIDFSNFINIGFDIQGILYDFFKNSDFYARREKISEYLNKIGLSLIYLYNLDQYIVVDKKSTGKSITIKTPSIEIKHLIGRKGNNINRIKREYNFKNISVKSIEVEEYQTLYKEFFRNLLFLVNQ